MLGNIGTTFLGLTVGCARCHDHKFDPVPARDYYRMLSAFTTTVRTEMDINLDPEGYELKKKLYDLEHTPLATALKKYEKEQLPIALAAWEKSRGPDSRVRRAVVVGAKSAARTRRPEWAEPLLDLLEPALKDENEYVRKNLGPFTIGDQFLRSYPDATLARLRKWMEDPDENVRWNVAMAFAAASGARLAQRAPDILDFLAKDERPSVRNAVRAARRRVRTLAA